MSESKQQQALGRTILHSITEGSAVLIVPKFKDGEVVDVELNVFTTDLIPQVEMFARSVRANNVTVAGAINNNGKKVSHEVN